jgi:hypothetical protein
MKNKGGVCFDVDVKDFAKPLPLDKDKNVQERKKAQPIDKKA